MNDETQRLTIINRLLASFPSGASGQGDDALDGYLIGTRDVPVDFLALAAQRFLAGSVPGQHMTFPPTPAQLATEARDHWYKRLEADRQNQARLAPPKPAVPEISDAERGRVKAKFEAWAADIARQKRTDDARRSKRHAEQYDAGVKRRVESGEFIAPKGSSIPISRTLAGQYAFDLDHEVDAA